MNEGDAAVRAPRTEEQLITEITRITDTNTLIDAVRVIEDWHRQVGREFVVTVYTDGSMAIGPGSTVGQVLQAIEAVRGSVMSLPLGNSTEVDK